MILRKEIKQILKNIIAVKRIVKRWLKNEIPETVTEPFSKDCL